MIGISKYLWPLLGLVATVQSAALVKVLYDRDRLIKSGEEIVLPVKPVDPRDIFRGEYVILGYDLSSIRQPGPAPEIANLSRGSTVYVRLGKGADGNWTVSGVSADAPKLSPDERVLKGQVINVWSAQDKRDVVLNVRYGIESYFVPEGTGRVLEEKVRDHKIEAIVAVGGDGEAALKGLVIDGERHVDPPLL
ncbi:hypothetical protein DLM45_15155 [Hyphomicrobium methylovorum]|uniref:GDYXXLXY domain-containing protein n=1 Tax=Hyphomicrobium methylovorum TaxID=84 RepID=UPI0015E6DF1B|nr:GDYXXLXY domain-containing protein [Hyphomicrobium methylovorum]MBA2127549.1 hypothetical protein [Hyphomicrobium methylovorum]